MPTVSPRRSPEPKVSSPNLNKSPPRVPPAVARIDAQLASLREALRHAHSKREALVESISAVERRDRRIERRIILCRAKEKAALTSDSEDPKEADK